TLGNGDFLDARSHREATDIIRLATLDRRDEITERHVRLAIALTELLAQGEEGCQLLTAIFAGEQPHVVADGIGRPETHDRLGRKPLFLDDLREHLLCIGPEGPRRLALLLVLENGRI